MRGRDQRHSQNAHFESAAQADKCNDNKITKAEKLHV